MIRRDRRGASLIKKRTVTIGSRVTSMAIEDAFWGRPEGNCGGRRDLVKQLAAQIDTDRQNANFSSAVRLYVLAYYWRLIGPPPDATLTSPAIARRALRLWACVNISSGSKPALETGNEGVASKIQTTGGSIGYVEFWYARQFGLRMATLQNKAGKFITPTADAGDLALSGRVALVKQLAASVADPFTPGAYPIPSFSWMLIYPAYRDEAKGAALREFAEWALSQQAQIRRPNSGIYRFPQT